MCRASLPLTSFKIYLLPRKLSKIQEEKQRYVSEVMSTTDKGSPTRILYFSDNDD